MLRYWTSAVHRLLPNPFPQTSLLPVQREEHGNPRLNKAVPIISSAAIEVALALDRSIGPVLPA